MLTTISTLPAVLSGTLSSALEAAVGTEAPEEPSSSVRLMSMFRMVAGNPSAAEAVVTMGSAAAAGASVAPGAAGEAAASTAKKEVAARKSLLHTGAAAGLSLVLLEVGMEQCHQRKCILRKNISNFSADSSRLVPSVDAPASAGASVGSAAAAGSSS